MDTKIRQLFDRAWQEPEKTVSEIKHKTGKKAVGMVHTDVPEELVHAAGALPVAVLAGEVPFRTADRHMQGFACTYSRSVIELVEGGELSWLDGLLVPYACDTTRCLDLILRFMDKFEYYDCVRIPKRVGADGVRSYYRAELLRVAGGLAGLTKSEVTNESLAAGITEYNRVRSLLEKLREAMRGGSSAIKAADYFSAARAAMILPPEEAAPLLEQAVKSAAGSGEADKKRPRVVVAGKLAEPPALVEVLEGSGLSIVEDHLVVGGRWIEAAPPAGDPWDALVQRQLERLPFAGIWDNRASRASHLAQRVKDLHADGAVYLVQKFCEPAELDVPGIREEIEAQGIPFLAIETDFSAGSLEAVRTRVEAFAEMLLERK